MLSLDTNPGPSPSDLRFLADCMLGKLAKWLRLLGYDTVYIHEATDDALVRIAVHENRVLLTKDHALVERRLVRSRCCLITAEGTGGQLRQVLRFFALQVDDSAIFTRCPVCNSDIRDVPREGVMPEIPPYVYQTQERFGRCSGCNRIYWRGTHVEHVLQALMGIG